MEAREERSEEGQRKWREPGRGRQSRADESTLRRDGKVCKHVL